MSPGKFFVFNYEVTFIYPNIAPFKGNETNLEARNKHEILFWKFLTCKISSFREISARTQRKFISEWFNAIFSSLSLKNLKQ